MALVRAVVLTDAAGVATHAWAAGSSFGTGTGGAAELLFGLDEALAGWVGTFDQCFRGHGGSHWFLWIRVTKWPVGYTQRSD
jgi:hypothetical protein